VSQPSERYPLEAARELRKKAVDDAGEALATAVRAHADAAQNVERARAGLARHDQETAGFVQSERAVGARRADDALIAQAYLARRRTERAERVAAVGRAEEDERAKERAVLAARDALASAKAEAEAVEKHHARWLEERRKRAEAKADEEVEDLVTARHGRE
jgi:colicin import membrane protein